MKDLGVIFAGCLLILVVILGGFFLGGLVIWVLWNQVIATTFGLAAITYWKGCGFGLAISLVINWIRNIIHK